MNAATDIWKADLPLWAVFLVAMLPSGLFAFVRPGEASDARVRAAHVAASIWYVAVAFALTLSIVWRGLPPAWPLWLAMVAVGLVPCCLVLAREIGGGYGKSPPGDEGSI